jgi:1-acyl-sn-glycerol-3-phosphate acyltransferase
MGVIRGSLRILLFLLILILSTLVIVGTAWIPVRIHGVRLCAWPLVTICRTILRLFNIRFTCLEAEKIRRHEGFIFPNHLSALDIVLLLSIVPVRFLAKAEIRAWPLVGWIARAVDTVFVDRSDKSSRETARQSLAHLSYYPPVVIFPEGGIYSPASELSPFRYGAFEIAQAAEAPFMPCVLIYEPLVVAFWADEPLLAVIWRFATRSQPLYARLYALRVVRPQPGDDPRQLALETRGAMAAALRYGGHEADVLEEGI